MSIHYSFSKDISSALVGSFILLIASWWFSVFIKHKWNKILFGISFTAFLLLLAIQSCWIYQVKNNPNHYTHYILNSIKVSGKVADLTTEKTKSYKTLFTIDTVWLNDTTKLPVTGDVLLYFNKEGNLPQYGDRLIFGVEHIKKIQTAKNPEEFDYARYMIDKNIYHQCYLKSNSYDLIKETTSSLFEMPIKMKLWVIDRLRYAGLSQDAFSICTALLVGYDDEIDKEVVTSFSHSGTLHVLSVSGLHTGILYAFVMFLFNFFDKEQKFKKLRWSIIMIVLWFFACITGFSPSVLRAVIMLSLIVTGKTYSQETSTYNILFVSAFILLVFNPYLIRDVGFLLSYTAVLGILYFEPILSNSYIVENKFGRLLWKWSAVSIAAQVSTLPITLLFFHQFPIWFIVANMIVIPVSVGLMVLALVLTIMPFQIMASFINLVMKWLLKLVALTDSTYGFIDNIPFNSIDAIYLTCILIVVILIIEYKRYVYCASVILLILGWLVTNLLVNIHEASSREMIVFNISKASYLQLKLGNETYAYGHNLSQLHYDRYIKPFNLTKGVDTILLKSNYIKVENNSIMVCSEYILPQKIEALNPNYIIVANNAEVKINPLKCDNLKSVILDGSNSYKHIKKLQAYYTRKGITCYNTLEGAYITKLN